MKRLLPTTLVAVLATASGCSTFSKISIFSKKDHAAPPKESSDISNQVEKDFMQRWVEKRVAELTASGTPAAAAHTQAIAEFKQKFPYTLAAQKAGPN